MGYRKQRECHYSQALETFEHLWVVQMVTLHHSHHQKAFAFLRQHLTAVFLVPSSSLGLAAPGGVSCAPLPASLVGVWPRSRGAVCQQSAELLCLQQWNHGNTALHKRLQKKKQIIKYKTHNNPALIPQGKFAHVSEGQ